MACKIEGIIKISPSWNQLDEPVEEQQTTGFFYEFAFEKVFTLADRCPSRHKDGQHHF